MKRRQLNSFFLFVIVVSFSLALVMYIYLTSSEASGHSSLRLPTRYKIVSRYKFNPVLDLDNGAPVGGQSYLLQRPVKPKTALKADAFNRKSLNMIDNNEEDNEIVARVGDKRGEEAVADKWHEAVAKPSAVEDAFLSLGMINNPEDRTIKEEGYKKHAFNLLISRRIGNKRSIPDTRHPLCKNQTFPPELPQTSVIVCFYNEAFSTLLRTVYSVLERTQDKLLKEIILVDDFSSDVDIKYKFMKYVYDKLPNKVKLIRTPSRAGLIRARMFGATHATGPVLVFLDSHVEVNVNWLPPLLARIEENSTNVVCPVIDIINANTFEYTASPIVRGGFNWGLHFKWDSVPNHLLQSKADFIKPIASPTMAGGLFAMDRKYFFSLGGYDKGMDIWGGENLEMSFRVWMCGGRLEVVPCSRVGHVFRQRRPYGSPSGEDTMTKNSLRVVHVWMDEYSKYYFETRPDASHVSYGDISERVALRKKLNCHSFDWYAKEIYPQLKPPTGKEGREKMKRKQKMKSFNLDKDLRRGVSRKLPYVLGRYQIQVTGTNYCVESENEVTARGSKLMIAKCLAIKRQLWSQTEKKELRLADGLCLDSDNVNPYLAKCHELGGTQTWSFSDKAETPLYNMAAGLCLGVRRLALGSRVEMTICSGAHARKWTLVSRMPIFH